MIKKTRLLLGVLLLLVSCSEEVIDPDNQLIAGVEVIFLNAERAYEYQKNHSRYIQEQIQQIDVSIVLEEDLSDRSLPEIRELYLENLKANTLNWTAREVRSFQDMLGEIFVEIRATTQQVLPDTLYMIKTTGDETIGEGAMYTVSKSITIPRVNTSSAGFGFLENNVKEVLRHELFHIYSNLNQEVRPDLYSIVGFYPIPLDLGGYEKRIIANPDTDYDWAIALDRNGERVEAVLLTYSLYESWEGNKSPLRLLAGKGYLDHGLFEVEATNGIYQLSQGFEEIEMGEVDASFRAQIGHNTDYTWAVEEIIADTYPLLFDSPEGRSMRDLEILQALQDLLH
ncbi:MAG TPA: hypothetical protein DCE41_18035 [Cytophagales bacterium]|nr:hypothetical protein [Cytophagales bacterium]HAA21305.1 hypothetical protein [Cytophagales bacterium]HAP59910.1 hypothetical protein [Cytophagales bacterium]